MITIQRVRVRWDAASRGAPHANARRGLDRPVTLPDPLPSCEVVVHDVLAGSQPREEVLSGGLELARDVGLWLDFDGGLLVVDRLPSRAAYPPARGPSRMCKLEPGQVGRYRANYRFLVTECPCNPSWFYESWILHISNGPVEPDRFVRGERAHDVDHRVHLYGGSGRRLA